MLFVTLVNIPFVCSSKPARSVFFFIGRAKSAFSVSLGCSTQPIGSTTLAGTCLAGPLGCTWLKNDKTSTYQGCEPPLILPSQQKSKSVVTRTLPGLVVSIGICDWLTTRRTAELSGAGCLRAGCSGGVWEVLLVANLEPWVPYQYCYTPSGKQFVMPWGWNSYN